jgi:hypothetical protein
MRISPLGDLLSRAMAIGPDNRLLAENNLLPGIGIHELVFGIPHYRIVNAAFCHVQPLGSRFNARTAAHGMPVLSWKLLRLKWRSTSQSSSRRWTG